MPTGRRWKPHYGCATKRGNAVTIQVTAVGPRPAATVLREALSLGVDRARLVVTDGSAVTADRAAAVLASLLRPGPKFDLVLGGAGAGGGEEGLVAALTAESLGVVHAGTANYLAARCADGEADAQLVAADGRQRVRSLPVAASLESGLPLRVFSIQRLPCRAGEASRDGTLAAARRSAGRHVCRGRASDRRGRSCLPVC